MKTHASTWGLTKLNEKLSKQQMHIPKRAVQPLKSESKPQNETKMNMWFPLGYSHTLHSARNTPSTLTHTHSSEEIWLMSKKSHT